MKPPAAVDLFAGVGGAALGLHRAGFRHVAFCERDTYCRRVLAKHWPHTPCYPDVHSILEEIGDDGFGEPIELVWASPPCQPASVAGHQRGTDDDRWLWPQTLDVVRAVRPRWFILENVPGLLALDGGMAIGGILSDLAGAGYAVQTVLIPAGAVGAPHRRERVFALAHSCGERRWKESGSTFADEGQHAGRAAPQGDELGCGLAANGPLGYATALQCLGLRGAAGDPIGAMRGDGQRFGVDAGRGHFGDWPIVPDVHGNWRRIPRCVEVERELRGGLDGFSARLDGHRLIWPTSPKGAERNRIARIKAMGNAVVPQVAEMIGMAVLAGMKAGGTT